MNKFFFMSTCLITFFCFSCSKKTIPEKPKETVQPEQTVVKPALPKPAPAKIIKTSVPKVIAVNDAVAKKAIDGRLYYDLEGKRYWRNNKDGKYYMYYKGMQDDPAFKKP